MSDMVMQLGGVIQREMDTLREVSQNVANANTPGYKANRVFSAFAQDTTGMPGLGTVQIQMAQRTENGALKQTTRPTDLAISGDGWFVLQEPAGGLLLTRDGRFHLDKTGQLVSQEGYPVMSQGGPFVVGPGLLKISPLGEVRLDDQVLGQLRVQAMPAPGLVRSLGEGRYALLAPAPMAEHFSVHQGVQERSNANLSSDMVKIMEVSRHVESVQRALSAYDGMLNTGINQLGKD